MRALQNQQPPVSKIDLHDLENSQIDWSHYHAKSKPTLKTKKQLRDHQRFALDAVKRGLSDADRGKLIMACGTGKTFTALKIAEELAGAGKRVLFLVPSLNLLSQTLTEWTQESATPLHSFAVCSDSDVGKKRKKDDDTVQTFTHELRYPATTEPARLATEMSKRHDAQHMSVVYSTYHSIDVISRAQYEHGLENFDLIICDEAHRTTGATFDTEDESNFVRVHDAEYIRSTKRLYSIGQTEARYVVNPQADLQFEIGEIERAIYAKLVQKVGNRHHWEDWANDIAKIARTHIDRITAILESKQSEANATTSAERSSNVGLQNPANTKEQAAFAAFAAELRDDLNDSITDGEIIEMLAQHLITKPVFDALFEDYSFAQHNPMSQAMQGVLDILQEHNLDKEADTLQSFYDSVKMRAEGIENATGKQKIVVELYDKFFRNAFPKMTERLGIVYTPVEVVDFIIHSVNHILQTEFGQTLGSKGVHILDPFTGTGTFITRLLQSGLITPEQLSYKYKNEIHANEIVLLAYYIAAINIEAVCPPQISDAVGVFAGYLLLDALVCNQDRHHENWGLIGTPEHGLTLAPTFDHASSLGRNETDETRRSRLNTKDKGFSVESYVAKARSGFFENKSSTKAMSTMDAFRECAKANAGAAQYWLDRLDTINEADFSAILAQIPDDFISSEARDFSNAMLCINRNRLLSLNGTRQT